MAKGGGSVCSGREVGGGGGAIIGGTGVGSVILGVRCGVQLVAKNLISFT